MLLAGCSEAENPPAIPPGPTGEPPVEVLEEVPFETTLRFIGATDPTGRWRPVPSSADFPHGNCRSINGYDAAELEEVHVHATQGDGPGLVQEWILGFMVFLADEYVDVRGPLPLTLNVTDILANFTQDPDDDAIIYVLPADGFPTVTIDETVRLSGRLLAQNATRLDFAPEDVQSCY